MILTITMNPSIDISYPLDDFKVDTVNRVTSPHKTAGGKGLNVTRVLAQLGEPVLASGLLGGKLGEFLEQELDQAGIQHSFYKITGETRNCIAILHQGNQTEILEQGPTIIKAESDGFLDLFAQLVAEQEIITISGSLPRGLDSDYYSRMIGICEANGKPVVLDCSGDSLLEVLKGPHKPLVIKPNTEELSQLLGKPVTDHKEELKLALSQPLFEGVEWVFVSLGAKGAFVKHREKFYQVKIPKIEVVNPVGSGDSTVAGITSALFRRESDEDLLKKANVLGMLNAQESLIGYINLANYQSLVDQIEVIEETEWT